MTPRALLIALLVASSAGAVKKGEKLYVRAKDTKVLEKADLRAKSVLLLQPGTTVKWLGPSPQNRQLHQVELEQQSKVITGWVLQANLSPNEPSAEFLHDDGKPIDAQAFKSSGAATKALGDMALHYGEEKKMGSLPERVMALESISQSIDPKSLDARNRALGLAVRDGPADDAKAPKKKGAKK